MNSTFDAAWQAAQGRLRDRLGAARTLNWVDEVAVVEVDRNRGRATLEARSYATVRQVREFQTAVEGELGSALGIPRLSVRVFARRGRRALGRPIERRAPAPTPEAARPERPEPPGQAVEAAPALPTLVLETPTPDTRHTLVNFVVGVSNRLAHGFALGVAQDPGNACWNPLLLHGGTGTGKTHLLHAIANAFAEKHPTRRVVIASAERFATQFSLAVRSGQAAAFRELYREADILVLDDIQHLAGKPETERELLHTIDELVGRRRQVVIASSLPPKRLPKVDAGLEGRLQQGLVVELRGPDERLREDLVRLRCAELKLPLDEAVVRLLTTRFDRTDQILGALKRLDAHSRLAQGSLALSEAQRVLADLLRGRDDAPTPAVIATFVGRALGVDPEALKGASRKPSVVRARQLAMALARRLTLLTLREVGAHFGGRSCACVHFAHRKVQLLRDSDPKIKAAFEEAVRRFSPSRAR